LNVEADFYYSKIYDFDDWCVAHKIFDFFNRKWGPYQVDRFADNTNCKVDVFNSQYWCPGSSGVDAFAYDWSGVNNWLVPPVHLVPRVISHMKACSAEGTLVIPKWESAIF
jgi:hypothetical protein